MKLLVLFSLVGHNLSAVFWDFNNPKLEDYSSLRSGSFHRGLLFSLTSAQKHALCLDYFSAQLYLGRELGGETIENEMIALINDGEPRTGSGVPQHALIVDKVGQTYDGEVIQDTNDVFFKCVGRGDYIDLRQPHSFGVYHISYAFRFGFFIDNFLEYGHPDSENMDIMKQIRFFSMSPEHVAVKPDDREEQYETTLRTIQVLQNESSDYVKLIQKKDDISSLPKWQKLFLCASILSSPTYRVDRLEFSFDWANKIEDDNLQYQERKVKSKNRRNATENLTADCIICTGYTNAKNKNKSTNLCLTRSYDDKNSLHVLKEEAKGLFHSKYFRYVPLLRNVAKKPLNEGLLHKNYWY